MILSKNMERRLTTVVAADMVGYSRLMAGDEEGTLDRLRGARAEVIDPAIRGRRAGGSSRPWATDSWSNSPHRSRRCDR